MAEIRAFRAFRYDMGRVGPLADVTAPPYDVIDAVLYEQLAGRSPFNVVHVDVPRAQPGDTAEHNRYTRSAALLREWMQSGVLRQDSAPAIYVCHQQFQIDGVRHIRRGFFAAVRLEPLATGAIFPHEQTFAGPKGDRLQLMQATTMNLSPVFAMYPDSESELAEILDRTILRSPPLETVDHLGTVSRLWPVTDQSVVSRITGLLGPKPLFIADGHHRYETCLQYLSERRAAGDVPTDDAPVGFTLMMLVGMSDPGLLIQPTHRLFGSEPGITIEQVSKTLAGLFEFAPVDSASDAWDAIVADGGQSLLAFGTAADRRWLLARFTRREAMRDAAPEHSETWRGLGVSILHRLVVPRLPFDGPSEYPHRWQEVESAITGRSCALGVLVPPATIEHVETIARGRETMPQKSTYFYPKLPTGLVLHSLKSR